MPSNTYPLIAKEGWPLLGLFFLATLVAYYYLGIGTALFFMLCCGFLMYLLRDPQQTVPSQPLAIVSPAHGTIIAVREVTDPWVERQAIQISMQVSLLDIYSLRSPIEGKIMRQWSRSKNAESAYRKFAFWVRGDEGDDVVVVINLNRLASKLFRFYAQSGERIGHGQRCGFLYLGGLIDIYLPVNCKHNLKAGDSITSGSGILAHMIHTGNESAISPDESTAAAN